MTDRPIIFSAPMVRALLDGRKTQTRRVLKPQPKVLKNGIWYRPYPVLRPLHWGYLRSDHIVGFAELTYATGDRLWVCEAQTLTLTVTDVRVQRLQDVSEADAIAEGVSEVSAEWQDNDEPATFPSFQAYGQDACFSGAGAGRLSFMTLWKSLHGADAWAANPWVEALTFTVQRGNIDLGSRVPG